MGTGIFSYPAAALDSGGRAAWLVWLLTGAAALGGGWMILRLSQRFPDRTFAGYARILLGTWLGGAAALLLAVLILLHGVYAYDVLSGAIVGTFFVYTPRWAVELLTAITVGYMAWTGIVRVARLAWLLLIFFLGVWAVTLFLASKYMDPGLVLPLWEFGGLHPERGSFWGAVFGIWAIYLLPMFLRDVDRPAKADPAVFGGLGLGWLVLGVSTLVPVMVLGLKAAQIVLQPFMYVASTLAAYRWPVERIELVVRAVFSFSAVTSIAVKHYVVGLIVAEVFGVAKPGPAIIGAAVVSYGLSSIVVEYLRTEAIGNWLIASAVLIDGLFLLLWVVYLWRRPLE